MLRGGEVAQAWHNVATLPNLSKPAIGKPGRLCFALHTEGETMINPRSRDTFASNP